MAKKTIKNSKYPYPKRYIQGLSKKDKQQQIRDLEESRSLYKKGIYKSRSQKASFKNKKSPHIVEFENKYGVNINNKSAVYKVTGVTPKAQSKILKKGMGAFYSSGSRPNQSAQSWAYARLASVILKHNAYPVDRHVLKENGCNNIKPPPKNKTKKTVVQQGGKVNLKKKKVRRKSSSKSTNSNEIISCCKINLNNEDEHKECIRKSDGRIFPLPRKFNRSKCKNVRGFTMESSCAPYKDC
jgi:hypothetical protein